MSDAERSAVIVDRPADRVLRLAIDRPPVNAIDSAAQRMLTAELAAAHDDTEVRAIVLTGTREHFCAGADLREEQELERDAVGGFLTGIDALFQTISNHRVPVIAAINGPAYGGGLELALACDVRVGCERSSFGAAGVNVGLVANFRSLVRAIGDARARHLLLTGWTCRAQQALDWGLMTDLVAVDELETHAVAMARRIASRAPLSVETTKDCLNQSLDLDEADATALQGRSFARLFRTEDHAEALRAFFDKRTGEYHRR